MTPVRAAWILGERREQRVVPALTKIVKKAKDAFLVENAVEALGKIGGTAATAVITSRDSAFESARASQGPRSFARDRIEEISSSSFLSVRGAADSCEKNVCK